MYILSGDLWKTTILAHFTSKVSVTGLSLKIGAFYINQKLCSLIA